MGGSDSRGTQDAPPLIANPRRPARDRAVHALEGVAAELAGPRRRQAGGATDKENIPTKTT